MPRVPRYEPQVQTQAMDAPRAQGVSPDAFGGGLARGLGAVANVAEDEARKQAELFNRAKFLEAVGMADREETELLDAPGGALTKTGNLAFGVTKPTLEQFDQRMSKIETGLESEDLRQAFTLYRLKKRNEAANRLNDHENRELIKYAEAKSSEVLASALDGVAVNADKPDVVESKISLGLGAIMTDPRIAGLPPEVLERKRQTWRQQVRTTVIDQLRENDASAGMQLQMAFAVIGKNQKYQQVISQDQAIQENLKTYLENLQHSVQETQLSPTQGRLGVSAMPQKPVAKGTSQPQQSAGMITNGE